MQAMMVTAFGGPEVLQAAQLPLPERKHAQLLIKNCAAAVNPIDAKICEGTNFVCKARTGDPLPWTLGFDFAGIVEEADANSSFKKGDRVAGSAGAPLHPCAYAQYLCADESAVVKIPDNISFAQASALITAGLTALSISDMIADEQNNVFIAGGSGGVGHLLSRYLKERNFKVSASCSSEHMDFLRPYVDHVYDYKKNLPQSLTATFDVVIDMPGGSIGKSLYSLLKKDGLMITVPTITKDEVIAACPQGMSAKGVHCERSAEHYSLLMHYASLGLVPHISKTLPLTQAVEALRMIKSGHTTGKIVLIP